MSTAAAAAVDTGSNSSRSGSTVAAHGDDAIHSDKMRAPIDPNMAAYKRTAISQNHPLWEDLAPEDSYVEDGTYWADLPRGRRTAWMNAQTNAEAKRELGAIGRMFKRDPLSPVTAYFGRYVITGFGLFTEGYTLFSIGNLTPLFQAVWPACWSRYTVCSENWIAAQTYLEIIGVIFGQVMVGIEADWVGRKFGLVQDALVMALGLVLLTAMWGTTLNGWVIMYAWSLFIYGIGVGGEYPMTSTTALEYKRVGGNHAENARDDRLHRGRNVVLAFLMQGWGQLFNQAVLIVLLLIFHGGGNPPYGKVSTQWTFRVQFGIMLFLTLYLAYYRYYRVNYRSAALRRAKAKSSVSGYDTQSLSLVCTHFGGRLFASAFGWFANDFAFYGNKLFQSSFIKVITPNNKSVMVTWLWNLVNIGVSLVGYYLAAFMIDVKWYGRNRMQLVGFIASFIFYIVPAIKYNYLQEPAHIHGFQAIYFLSSFFQQFGPNCTTFLVAAEIFPVAVRGTAHGFSAACGKLGALVPAIMYNYVPSHTRFWVVCWFNLAGAIVTIIWLPDTTGLDLREQERYWSYVRSGRAHEYHGIAVHPRHLSLWEKVVLKRHLAYDADLDREAKLAEMREEYQANLVREKEDGDEEEDGSLVSGRAHEFFTSEKMGHHAYQQNAGYGHVDTGVLQSESTTGRPY